MIYQHPLAYLLGLEGVALLRAFAGDHDRAFTEARIAEIRRLLDDPALAGEGELVERMDIVDAYRIWSATYDGEPRNGLFDLDEPILHEILDKLPAGVALDAACGTGRFAEHLASRGHQVIGVDSSPDMLARAQRRVPDGDFRLGPLARLPLDDDQVDVVVCTLALTHVAALAPVFAEFARVLLPGGHLVISDVHYALADLGAIAKAVAPDGERGLLPVYRHRASDYLGAALPLGLRVRRCEEPRFWFTEEPKPMPADITVGPWPDWPWSLINLAPAAASAAGNGVPAIIVWHFQLDGQAAATLHHGTGTGAGT
ncbi:class I SAM-dependent methyltransferase [Actinomycetes bacterium KLBMP 9797]